MKKISSSNISVPIPVNPSMGKKFAIKILNYITVAALNLRYKIEINGLEKIANDGKGILFLPNHPALIDPIILSAVLYKKFFIRALIDRDQMNLTILRQVARIINPIFIDNIYKNTDGAKKAIDEVINSIKANQNILLYPSGSLMRSGRENLRANFAVEQIVSSLPSVRIVLVRISGLWGSSFSHAKGTPSFNKSLVRGIKAILANAIFFMPKRKITLDFLEPEDFPRTSSRKEINLYLENFYTPTSMPVVDCARYWWYKHKTVIKNKVELNLAGTYDVSDVPENIRLAVNEYLQEISDFEDVLPEHNLSRDLLLDSILQLQLHMWIKKEFGAPHLEEGSLSSVADCMRAAANLTINNKIFEGIQNSNGNQKWFEVNPNTTYLTNKKTLGDAFLEHANAHPNEPFMLDSFIPTHTRREVLEKILILKQFLGRIENRKVGIMLPSGVTAFITYFSLLFSGKLPVFLNWTLGRTNLEHCLHTSQVEDIVTSEKVLSRIRDQGIEVESLPTRWLVLEDIRNRIGIKHISRMWLIARSKTLQNYIIKKSKVDETAVILFTSGTEARPKAIALTHKNFYTNMKDLMSIKSFNQDDSFLGFLPPFHSFGFFLNIVMPSYFGIRVLFHSNPTESGVLYYLMHHFSPTMMLSTPSFLRGVLNSIPEGEVNNTLKLVIVGAEKCPESLSSRFTKYFPQASLCEGYGATECSPVISVNHPDNIQPGTVGFIMPSLQYIIVYPDARQIVEQGSIGLLLVSGDSVFSGYLADENNINPSPFLNINGRTWYNTGDLVTQESDGSIKHKGKIKRFVKIGGEMISLPAIEDALNKQLCKDTGKVSLAIDYIESTTIPQLILFSTFEISIEQANRAISEAGLSPLHNIRQIINIEEIPIMGSGKVNYQQLKRLIRQQKIRKNRK